MSGPRKTRAQAEIEAQLETLEPGSERHQLLVAARDFKAAWVTLGNLLTRIKETALWQDWGFSSFESYSRRELKLRRDTVNKLTRSYSFLRDHEPVALEQRRERELPPLDVVDLLSQARDRTRVTDDQMASIQEEIFDPQTDMPSKSQVVKKFRALDPEAFRTAPKQTQVQQDTRKALMLADRLLELVQVQEGLSQEAIDGVARAAEELRTIFEAQRQAAA